MGKSKLKTTKSLPTASKLGKGSSDASKVRKRKRKLPLEFNVDVVDFMEQLTNENLKDKTSLDPAVERRKSAFLDFVESCESDSNDLVQSNSASVSFFTKQVHDKTCKSNKSSSIEPEIVVVETGIMNPDDYPDIDDNIDLNNDDYDHEDDALSDFEDNINDMFTHEQINVDLETESPVIKDKFVLYREDHRTLVVLSHPLEVCFQGKARMKSLLGSFEILSYVLEDTSQEYCEVISPNCNSYLTLKTLKGKPQKQITNIHSDIFKDINIKELQKNVEDLLQGECVVITCEEFCSPVFDYLGAIPHYSDIFNMAGGNSSFSLSMLQNTEALVVNTSQQIELALFQWTNLLKKLQNPVIMVVGGKNSGKSTLNRMLLNTSLNIIDFVSFLDCDVGQAEFTPPGFVSLHNLHEPILGPPFSHQKCPTKMCYYGEITPSRNLTRYINTVEHVYNYYKHEMVAKQPLIVNTLGWNEGLGIPLIIDLIQIIQPSIIIQLKCEYNYNNFPLLTSEFLSSTPGWLSGTNPSEITQLDSKDISKPSLLVINSDAPSKHKTMFKAAQYRELATIVYIHQSLNFNQNIFHMQPYTIEFSHLALHDGQNCGDYKQIFYSLNASVVGLCESDLSKCEIKLENGLRIFKETPLCFSVGLGVVRAIDIKKGVVYLITPVPEDKLVNVNLLMKGAVQLPDIFHQNQFQSMDNSELPYIGHVTKSIGSGALIIRNKMPRKQYVSKEEFSRISGPEMGPI